MWSFMDLRQQYWPRWSLSQYCCWRSIKPILPDIIGQYLLYYMSNIYGSSPLVYGYIYCYILLNNLLSFPVLQSGAWCYYCDTILSYCDVRYNGSTRVTFLSNNSTIWCHNSTIRHHNSKTMTIFNLGKYWLVNMVFWVSMHHYWRLCEQESTNQLWVFTFDI